MLEHELPDEAAAVFSDIRRADSALGLDLRLDAASMAVDEYADRFAAKIRDFMAKAGYSRDLEHGYQIAADIWALARR